MQAPGLVQKSSETLVWLESPWGRPLGELVENFRWQSRVFDQFSLIHSSELDHQTIIEATRSMSLDSVFDPFRSKKFESLSYPPFPTLERFEQYIISACITA